MLGASVNYPPRTEMTPEAKPLQHTQLPVEASEHPSSAHTHSVLTADGCTQNVVGALRRGEREGEGGPGAPAFVSVCVNVN